MGLGYYLHTNLIQWVLGGTSHALADLAVDPLMFPLSHGEASDGPSEAWGDPKGPP